ERLLEGGGEALHELVREPPDEADRVRDEVAASVVLEGAGGRVERLEQAVLDRHRRVRERVQERRLADVRVAGERDRRRVRAAPLLAADGALPAQLCQPAPEDGDAAARQPAVGLEL